MESIDEFLIVERSYSDDESKLSVGLANIHAEVPDVEANKSGSYLHPRPVLAPRLQSARSSLSRVIGRSRTRTPVAWCTAFATAAAVPTIPISPTPLAPIGLT
ncbi:MAG: hypothetical protein QOK16_3719 [Solirubrobacteraceae bacterium]|nr:hypothetical protein [Solirubrobacteraceae bacterium]